MKLGRPRSLKYPDRTPVEVEGVSGERRWQIARRAAVKCEGCGQALNKYAAMCDDCAKKNQGTLAEARRIQRVEDGQPR